MKVVQLTELVTHFNQILNLFDVPGFEHRIQDPFSLFKVQRVCHPLEAIANPWL